MEKKIKSVSSNVEKAQTYGDLMRRYNKAIKEGFFFEAMLIEYAMIEDRLLAFLYHCGVQNGRDSLKISKISRNKLLKPLFTSEDGKEKRLSLNGVGRKIEIIDAILTWECSIACTPDDKYMKTLKTQCESLDILEFQEILKNILTWKNYRNEIIHGLLNKNINALQAEIENNVTIGMLLARGVDKQVKIIKKGNKIRKAAKLPITL